MLVLHAIPLDGNRKELTIHSREMRRAFQTGGDYLMNFYNCPETRGLIRLLNQIVSDKNLVPKASKASLVGIWNTFSDGTFYIFIFLDLRFITPNV